MVEATEPGAEPGKMVEWASLWLKPAGMAAVVMLLFAFAFSGKKADESTPMRPKMNHEHAPRTNAPDPHW